MVIDMCRNRKEKKREKEKFDLMYNALFITGNNRPLVRYPQNNETSQKWRLENLNNP